MIHPYCLYYQSSLSRRKVVLGIVQVFLDGLADELFEAVLALSYVRGVFLFETGIASCYCRLLFVFFDAAAVDWGDWEDVVCEVVVAFLKDYRLCLRVELVGPHFALVEGLDGLCVFSDPSPFPHSAFEIDLLFLLLLVGFLSNVLLDADVLVVHLAFIVTKSNIIHRLCHSLRRFPCLLVGHQLIVIHDVALGEELELTIPIAVDIG